MRTDFDLRALQLAELEMMKDVTRFCEDNGIQYFLSSGTLIGAARHKGFIPWDDDVDINMDLKNYRKFLALAKDGLSDKYFIQNVETEPKMCFPWTKIRINGTTSMDPRLTNLDVHFGICMDIFIINGIPNSPFRRRLQQLAVKVQIFLLYKYFYLDGDGFVISKPKRLLYKLMPEFLRRGLIRLLDKFILYDIDGCDTAYNVFSNTVQSAEKIPVELVKEFDKLTFEGTEFFVPKRWDEYLTLHYGDWRTPLPEGQRDRHGDIIVDLERDYTNYIGERLKAKKAKSSR